MMAKVTLNTMVKDIRGKLMIFIMSTHCPFPDLEEAGTEPVEPSMGWFRCYCAKHSNKLSTMVFITAHCL